MARRRMIDPYFWKSEKFFKKIFSACQIVYPQKSKKWYLNFSRTVRLFYISLWNFADDEGILLLNFAQIKGDCLSFDDDFDESMIKDCIKVLNISKRIYLYENSEIKYGIICNFKEHQTISHPTPTKHPPPNDVEFREWLRESLPNGSGMTPSQVKLREVKLSKDKDTSAPSAVSVDNLLITQNTVDPEINKFTNSVNSTATNPPTQKTEQVNPPGEKIKLTPREIQNIKIETTRVLFKDVFGVEIKPAQVQMLVMGSPKRKIAGFGSHEAFRIWIEDNRTLEKRHDIISWVIKLSQDHKTMEMYHRRAFGKEKDAQLIGSIFEQARLQNLTARGRAP